MKYIYMEEISPIYLATCMANTMGGQEEMDETDK
jgi:hypothetical protein